MKKATSFRWFRHIAAAEGISFLLLLFIAMPLKYFSDMPMAVTVVGGIHGALVVAFLVMAYDVVSRYNKSWLWLFKSVVASLLPFGTFVMDHKVWKKEQAEIESAA